MADEEGFRVLSLIVLNLASPLAAKERVDGANGGDGRTIGRRRLMIGGGRSCAEGAKGEFVSQLQPEPVPSLTNNDR